MLRDAGVHRLPLLSTFVNCLISSSFRQRQAFWHFKYVGLGLIGILVLSPRMVVAPFTGLQSIRRIWKSKEEYYEGFNTSIKSGSLMCIYMYLCVCVTTHTNTYVYLYIRPNIQLNISDTRMHFYLSWKGYSSKRSTKTLENKWSTMDFFFFSFVCGTNSLDPYKSMCLILLYLHSLKETCTAVSSEANLMALNNYTLKQSFWVASYDEG